MLIVNDVPMNVQEGRVSIANHCRLQALDHIIQTEASEVIATARRHGWLYRIGYRHHILEDRGADHLKNTVFTFLLGRGDQSASM